MWRGEAGQTTVEWVAGTALVLLLVLAVLSTQSGVLDRAQCVVRAEIDRVMTIDGKAACKP